MNNTSNVNDEKFINLIKSRMFEIQHELKQTVKPEDRATLKDALMNNCAWLISLGQSVDRTILSEV